MNQLSTKYPVFYKDVFGILVRRESSPIFFLALAFHLLGCYSQCSAQTLEEAYYEEQLDKLDLKQEEWEAITSGIDYSKDQVQESKEDPSELEPGNAFSPDSNSSGFSPEVGGAIMKVFVFILGAILLFFLIRNLLQLRQLPKNKKIGSNGTAINIEQIEENLAEMDLQQFIRQALAEKNYALAIRLHYLLVLQTLSEKDWIRWKKDKTNQEYLREIQSEDLKQGFRTLTRIFDRVWYGKSLINEADFALLEPEFKAFNSKIVQQQ